MPHGGPVQERTSRIAFLRNKWLKGGKPSQKLPPVPGASNMTREKSLEETAAKRLTGYQWKNEGRQVATPLLPSPRMDRSRMVHYIERHVDRDLAQRNFPGVRPEGGASSVLSEGSSHVDSDFGRTDRVDFTPDKVSDLREKLGQRKSLVSIIGNDYALYSHKVHGQHHETHHSASDSSPEPTRRDSGDEWDDQPVAAMPWQVSFASVSSSNSPVGGVRRSSAALGSKPSSSIGAPLPTSSHNQGRRGSQPLMTRTPSSDTAIFNRTPQSTPSVGSNASWGEGVASFTSLTSPSQPRKKKQWGKNASSITVRHTRLVTQVGTRLDFSLLINLCDQLEKLPALTHLDLSGAWIMPAGAAMLGTALESLTCVTHLDMGNCDIRTVGMARLLPALNNNLDLTYLGLASNNIGDVGATALGEALRFCMSLNTLDLSSNQLSGDGVEALKPIFVATTRLMSLDLSSNVRHFSHGVSQGHKLAEKLAKSLRGTNCSLTHLSLANNAIFAGGAHQILRTMMENSHSLTSLDLGSNGSSPNRLSPEGLHSLQGALISITLKHLDLSHNNLGTAGAKTLSIALSARSQVETINLASNNLGSPGFDFVAKFLLSKHANIRKLNLSSNNLHCGAMKNLAEALEGLECLSSLSLADNPSLCLKDPSPTEIGEVQDCSGVIQLCAKLRDPEICGNLLELDLRNTGLAVETWSNIVGLVANANSMHTFNGINLDGDFKGLDASRGSLQNFELLFMAKQLDRLNIPKAALKEMKVLALSESIDLSHCDLSEYPSALFHIWGLRTIDLSHNLRLRSLPIGNLIKSNILELVLDGCRHLIEPPRSVTQAGGRDVMQYLRACVPHPTISIPLLLIGSDQEPKSTLIRALARSVWSFQEDQAALDSDEPFSGAESFGDRMMSLRSRTKRSTSISVSAGQKASGSFGRTSTVGVAGSSKNMLGGGSFNSNFSQLAVSLQAEAGKASVSSMPALPMHPENAMAEHPGGPMLSRMHLSEGSGKARKERPPSLEGGDEPKSDLIALLQAGTRTRLPSTPHAEASTPRADSPPASEAGSFTSSHGSRAHSPLDGVMRTKGMKGMFRDAGKKVIGALPPSSKFKLMVHDFNWTPIAQEKYSYAIISVSNAARLRACAPLVYVRKAIYAFTISVDSPLDPNELWADLDELQWRLPKAVVFAIVVHNGSLPDMVQKRCGMVGRAIKHWLRKYLETNSQADALEFINIGEPLLFDTSDASAIMNLTNMCQRVAHTIIGDSDYVHPACAIVRRQVVSLEKQGECWVEWKKFLDLANTTLTTQQFEVPIHVVTAALHDMGNIRSAIGSEGQVMRPMLDTLIVNFTLMVEFLRVAPPAAATWKRWQIIDYIRRCANPHAVPPANISVASLLVLEESPTNSPRELGSLSELDSPEKQVEEETTNLDSEDLCLASPVSSLASPTSADRTFGDESSPIVPIERSTNQPKPSRKSKFFGSLTPLGEESVTESPHSFYETPVPHMVPNAPQEDTSRDETEVDELKRGLVKSAVGQESPVQRLRSGGEGLLPDDEDLTWGEGGEGGDSRASLLDLL